MAADLIPAQPQPQERMIRLLDGNIPEGPSELPGHALSNLPPEVEATINRTIGHRSSLNWAPAILHRELLQIPLWQNPEFAAKPQHAGAPYMRDFTHRDATAISRQRIETINVLGMTNERRQLSAHGLLRYLDLDVLMAVTYAATERRRSHIAIDQVEFLRTMGYVDLAQAPYLALKASFERLRHTMIKVYDLDGRGQPLPDVRTYQLITTFKETNKNGRDRRIEVNIGDWWMNAMQESSWQLVDIGAYVHLVRNHRLNGLARVLFLYLSSVRSRDSFFQAKLDWIQERFAPRRKSGLAYHEHPLSPNSDLRAAIELLCQEKVLTLMPINAPESNPNEGFLRGYFCPSKRFAGYLRADLAPRQLTLFPNPGIFDAQPQPTAIEDASEDTTAIPPEAQRDPFLDYIEALISFIQRYYEFRIPNSLMGKARAMHWTPVGILHVLVTALDKANGNCGGYAASIIRRGFFDPSVREGFEVLSDKHEETFQAIAKSQFAPRWDKSKRVVLPPEADLDERRRAFRSGQKTAPAVSDPNASPYPARQHAPLRGTLIGGQTRRQ